MLVNNSILKKTSELATKGEPFVVATVVSCENPTSAKPGAKAIVLENGSLFGWIGGSCAQPIVIEEARKALSDGLPKLLRIGAKEASDFGQNNGVKNYEMTCYSGGTMEIFIEPMLSKSQLLLIGNSPDLQMLAKLGHAMNFDITVSDPEIREGIFPEEANLFSEIPAKKIKNPNRAFVVIATHGRYDEDALLKVIAMNPAYLGLIASKKRAKAIFSYLKKKGASASNLKKVKSPAGLDIGAKTPDEIALSILAEIVRVKRHTRVEKTVKASTPQKDQAIDPICGMTVNLKTSKLKTEYGGTEYYFCCAGCLQTFEKNPEKYLTANV